MTGTPPRLVSGCYTPDFDFESWTPFLSDCGCAQQLGLRGSHQTVGNVLEHHGLLPAPDRERKTSWREFIRSHTEVLAAVDFFTAEVWASAGLITYYVLVFIKAVTLPPRSPNLNAHCERWIRSVKDELLSKMILFGESSLRHCLENYVNHFHAERNHQGKGNVILFPAPEYRIGEMSGDLQTRERLDGLLKFYYRDAARVF
ncbi:MAG: hypothetical protein EXS36_11340 [Pedosphaera sp.]|nr:hypothetical protein [Pedosphaera sp.]